MSQLKKKLALFLAVIMLISTASVVSYAEEPQLTTSADFLLEGDAPVKKNAYNLNDEGGKVDKGVEKTAGKDTVVYNLGSQEITVGYDEEQANAAPWNYKLFDEDGDYTILLEDNAFFPYEVQFQDNATSGSALSVEWFETPDDTVQIGEHTFSVYSEQNDDTMLSQIGVWIDGDYIAARPEPKKFTNSLMQPMSMLPLTEVTRTLNLPAYSPTQLKNVELSTVLSIIGSSGTAAVYARTGNDDFKILSDGTAMLDLSGFYPEANSSSYQLIVGTTNQLDMSNIRYIITFNLTAYNPFDFELYDETNTTLIPNVSEYYSSNRANSDSEWIPYYRLNIPSSYKTTEKYALRWDLRPFYGTSVTVYEGFIDAPTGSPITSGLQVERLKYKLLTAFITRLDGEEEVYQFQVHVNSRYTGISYDGFMCKQDSYRREYVYCTTSSSSNNNVQTITYTLPSGYSADDYYYYELKYFLEGSLSNDSLTKAVEGHYDSLSAAASATDIKDQLFPASSMDTRGVGYRAIFGGNGVNFTVFADSDVYKYTIKAVELSEPPTPPVTDYILLPNPGNNDTYFQVNGAKDASGIALDTYVMPYKHDTYYDKGFQTVLSLDSNDLTSISPTFWKGSTVDVRVDSVPQNSGAAPQQNFSAGPVKYFAVAQDGTNLKNYWVTFVSKNIGGAKLFVNGINGEGEDANKREVFLDNAYENIHDIFIANMGDEELKGLSVDLSATNVKLDPYWTVGGTGNDELAAFTTTNSTQPGVWQHDSHSELPNVAKIRLLPDGEGDISGTLRISSTNGGSETITLTGTAGNPKITTTSIPEAVKYVPYSEFIEHTNKHDWNTVTFELDSGTLPQGVALKPNGEIYGVPKQTGSFPITVRMENSYSGFGDATASFTLIVKDNTNSNVFNSTDIDYDVTKHVGNPVGTGADADYIVTAIADHEFITDGEMPEFIDFWLNGEKLNEYTDYTKVPGSTRITIKSQTFQNKTNKNGNNTIAAEFRVEGNEDKELKRAAQNFKMDVKSGSNNNSGNNSNGGSSSSGRSSSGGGSSSGSGSTQFTAPNPVNTVSNDTITVATIVSADNMKKALELATSGVAKLANNSGADTKISKAGFDELTKAENVSLEISSKDIVLTFSNQALKGIGEQAKGDIVFHAGFADKSTLSEEQKAIIGDNPVIDLSVVSDGMSITNFDGDVTISFPYKPTAGKNANAIVLYYVDANGKLQIIHNAAYDPDKGIMTFTTDHFSIYMVGYNYVAFYDMANHWGKSTVEFVAARDLVSGIGNGKYDPDRSITRAEFIQMLQNVLMLPAAGLGTAKYDDVTDGTWFYNSVMAAKSAGLLKGLETDANNFMPNQTFTREEMVIILANAVSYRKISIPDKDVDLEKFKDHYEISDSCLNELRIVIKVGLMSENGMGSGMFNPRGLSTRAQAAQIQKNMLNVFK